MKQRFYLENRFENFAIFKLLKSLHTIYCYLYIQRWIFQFIEDLKNEHFKY